MPEVLELTGKNANNERSDPQQMKETVLRAGESFNIFLENKFNQLKIDEGLVSKFIDQFYRNHWYRKNFVPVLSERMTEISSKIYTVNGIPTYFYVDSNTVSDRKLVLKREIIDGEISVKYVPWVIKKMHMKTYLFNISSVDVSGIGVYKVVEKRGIPNLIIEYDIVSNLRTIIKSNKLPEFLIAFKPPLINDAKDIII